MKNLILALALILTNQIVAQTTTIEGVKLPNQLATNSGNLTLNGGGVREKYFLDLYVGALYLKAKNQNAASIMQADEPMAIKLHIVSGLITSEKMIHAVDEGFSKSTKGKMEPLMPRIKQFKNTFSSAIKEGDIFDLIYEPKKGVSILKNGKESALIPGLDFKTAMFGIWLCEDPADSDLKKAMVGK